MPGSRADQERFRDCLPDDILKALKDAESMSEKEPLREAAVLTEEKKVGVTAVGPFASGGRMKAKEVLLDRAATLRKRADHLESLARVIRNLEDEQGTIPYCLDQALWAYAQGFGAK